MTLRKQRRASALMESTLWIPILILLLMGMVEFARVTYTYFTLHKILNNVARSAAKTQGLNFCADDGSIDVVKNFAINGGLTEGSPILPSLDAEQILVRIERIDPAGGDLIECDCSSSGCDTSAGGSPPDYVAVSLTDGYPFTFRIPGLTLDPIPLRTTVRVPFGGS